MMTSACAEPRARVQRLRKLMHFHHLSSPDPDWRTTRVTDWCSMQDQRQLHSHWALHPIIAPISRRKAPEASLSLCYSAGHTAVSVSSSSSSSSSVCGTRPWRHDWTAEHQSREWLTTRVTSHSHLKQLELYYIGLYICVCVFICYIWILKRNNWDFWLFSSVNY